MTTHGFAIATLLVGLTVPSTAAPDALTLLERGRYDEALEAAAGLDAPDARAIEIQARLALREMDEQPADLLALIEQHLAERGAVFGTSSAEYGQVLLWRSLVTESANDLARARALCKGRRDLPCEAEAMSQEARVHSLRSRFQDAYRLARDAWMLHGERLGSSHPSTAQAQATAARYCAPLSRPECVTLANEAVATLRASTSSHPHLAFALLEHGRLIGDGGDMARARALFEESLRISERTFGHDSSRLLRALGFLSVALERLGETPSAVDVGSRVVAIAEKRVGASHRVTGTFLSNLGGLQLRAGDLIAGTRSAERAVAILEATAPGTVELANALNGLADARIASGDYGSVQTMLERSLALMVQASGEESLNVYHARARLAEAAHYLGQFDRALNEYSRAIDLARRVIGPRGQELQDSLLERARTLVTTGRLAEARRDLDEVALLIGTQGDRRAHYHEMRAHVATAEGRRSDALQHGQLAVAEFRRIASGSNQKALDSLVRIAEAQEALGHRADAVATALDAESTRRQALRAVAEGMPTRTALMVRLQDTPARDLLVRLATLDAAHTERAWDAVVRSRALVLDAVAERARLARSSEDTFFRQKAQTLADARSALARAVVRGPGAQTAEAFASSLTELRMRAEKAEVDLATASEPFRSSRTESLAGLDVVVRSLPPQSALVAYVVAGDQMVAFVHDGDVPRAVALGNTAGVTRLVREWRLEIQRERAAGGRAATDNERRSRRAGLRLRRAIWDPIEPFVARRTRVFLVPDGSLSSVSFAGLPTAPGRYLVESGPLLHLLSTERDLLTSAPSREPSGLLAVGAPAFGGRTGPAVGVRAGRLDDCTELATARFLPLPASAAEARGIAALWSSATRATTRVLVGSDATKAAVVQLSEGREVVHIATHGFFVPRQCNSNVVLEQNPMLRAGLVLAGANDDHTRDAGILTAEELANLRLDGTRWVVLSGCDTGLGDVRASEGVLGLRRAVLTAGARSVIGSLWAVDDNEARQWMLSLYRGHFERGQDTAEAVRGAQRARLRARRAAGGSTHPFYWAGFVAVGDWR